MKIVSYNINKYSSVKLSKVLSMEADIYILPECANKNLVTLPEGYDMEWCGDDDLPDKGLGIIWKDTVSLMIAPGYRKIKHILPLYIDGVYSPLFIMASWPTVWKEKKTYPQLLLEGLKEYTSYFQNCPSMVIGDLNCFIGQKGVTKKTGTFEDCIEMMNDYGLKSLYHEKYKEVFGKESTNTFFMYYQEDRPYFLDYAFTSFNVKTFEIGEWDKSISDHKPLIIEF